MMQLKKYLILGSVLGTVIYNLPRFFELQAVNVDKYDEASNINYTVR